MLPQPVIHIYSSPEALATGAAELILRQTRALPATAFMSLALSGGSTPKKIYEYWAVHFRDSIPWHRIQLFWVDERCVPPESEQSNYKMIRETLIDKVPIPPAQVFPIFGDRTPHTEAQRYSREITTHVPSQQGIPQFDLILLGIGQDGHTASIFPGQNSLFRTPELCAVSMHPQTRQTRITLTGTLINHARQVAFIVTGPDKATPLGQILNPPQNQTLPASWVHPTQGNLLWLLDKAAASRLTINNS